MVDVLKMAKLFSKIKSGIGKAVNIGGKIAKIAKAGCGKLSWADTVVNGICGATGEGSKWCKGARTARGLAGKACSVIKPN